MAYRVNYDANWEVLPQKRRRSRLLPMTAAAFLVFLVLVNVSWPEGRRLLWCLVLPNNPEAAEEVLEAFASELRQGKDIFQVLKTFCQEAAANVRAYFR